MSDNSHLLGGDLVRVTKELAVGIADLEIVETVLHVGNGQGEISTQCFISLAASIAVNANTCKALCRHQ